MNTKIDSITEDINNESKKEFEKCILIMETDQRVKKSFYYFLLNDLIIKEDNTTLDMDDLLNNYSDIFDDYFRDIYSNIAEKNRLDEFKNNIKIKVKNIKNKIIECNTHIEILKKEYLNTYFTKYIPLNNKNYKNKLRFENKTVLKLPKPHSYILGEFFARYIFNSIKNNKNNNSSNENELKLNCKTFYDEININSYIDIDKKNITPFSDISNNFKYWVILLLLIGQLFNIRSDYNLLFDETNFEETILKINKNPKKDKDKSKDKNKEKLKKFQSFFKKGGFIKQKNTSKYKRTGKREEGKREEGKKGEAKREDKKNSGSSKDYYEGILKNTYYNNENLYTIYYKNFNNNIKLFFKNQILDQSLNKLSSNGKFINIKDINIKYPFSNNKEIALSKILKKDKIFAEGINNEALKKIEYTLYNSVEMLLDINNKKEINIFISKIKYKFILILYYLYNNKKKLYEKYLTSINNIFNINKNNSENNNDNNENNENNENNNITSNNNITINLIGKNVKNKKNKTDNTNNTNNINNNTNNINNNENNINNTNNSKNNNNNTNISSIMNIDIINKKIKKINSKITILNNKKYKLSMIEYDELLLKYENKIQKLLIQKSKLA